MTKTIDQVREATGAAQAAAADPQASVWVNANAGTGKTRVLTLRVLRLLLAGTEPQRILCLTYTKAAASEMARRVFDQLSSWVTFDGDKLVKALTDITGTKPDTTQIALARTLFTRAIETPGGLKVQTIHAFSERLLQRFPLEAGVPPGFKILDDDRGRELKARAIEAVLLAATANPDTPLARSLATAIRFVTEDSFDGLLNKAIAEHAWLDAASRIDLGNAAADFTGAEKYLRKILGVPARATRETLERDRAAVLSQSELAALQSLLLSGSKTDTAFADMLAAALKMDDAPRRANILADFFMVNRGDKKEKGREKLMTIALAKAQPSLSALADTAQQKFIALSKDLKSTEVIEASVALYHLAGAVLQRYRDAKVAAGALDFDDLILRTRYLLSASDNAAWVQYKLDGGLDHILVDEAQDTSPDQWQIIKALGEEFFSGQSARDVTRTVFAVGDEKQSIYSFQGARPEMFAKMAETFAKLAHDARVKWRPVDLSLSFRTVQQVLDGVDAVFSNASRTPGLTSGQKGIKHDASRAGHAGRIEVWRTEPVQPASSASPWLPLDDTAARAPAHRLADKIASTIKGWLETKQKLLTENREIRAGDILILVRKRHPFAAPMIAALKSRQIPVAGADRMALIEQIAVQDLLAIGDFVTLPEDDLALACVLKSPMFNFTDDDLLAFAPNRKGALWKAFLAHASANSKFKIAAELLKKWRAKADYFPPFEFYSGVLERDFGRSRLLQRLGNESADAIDEFLDAALTYDDGAPPSLTGFLAHMRAAAREIKRDMEHGRDEVRVMTVHAAKGLEAPVVFLPDTCSADTSGKGQRLISISAEPRPSATPDPVVWAVKGTSSLEALAAASQAKAQRETEERNRLLYVAMTRARDQLFVAGFEGKKARSPECWYDLICNGLNIVWDDVKSESFVLETKQTAPPEEAVRISLNPAIADELPEFAKHRAPPEPQLSVPLAPSRLEAYASDADGEPLLPSKTDPAVTRDNGSPLANMAANRFLRGTLTHALLEHLPALAPATRKIAAENYVAKRGNDLLETTRVSIVREALAILNDENFAPIFSPNSRAEVPISATVPRPTGKGPALKLSGQIDRLAVTDDDILIVDYKTNRPPPGDVAQVPPAYLYQLAAYVLALGEIYPKHSVRAALLWTDGPRLMEIPKSVLVDYGKMLWDLDLMSLDAV